MQKNEQTQKRPHSITLDERNMLKATGVTDVEGFDETKIYAMLDKTAFTITGKGLKVISFSSESGNLHVEGEVDSIVYSAAVSRKAGIFSRIFR